MAKLDASDEVVLRSAITGEGLIPLTAESLTVLTEAAKEVAEEASEVAAVLLTPERAAQVKQWRVVEGYSWRAVARAAYEAWEGTWAPPSNQLWGMEFCDAAMRILGETVEQGWN